jgi:hypothetical protein
MKHLNFLIRFLMKEYYIIPKYLLWNMLNYRCANFKKKYVVAYLDNSDEIIICDFTLQRLLH